MDNNDGGMGEREKAREDEKKGGKKRITMDFPRLPYDNNNNLTEIITFSLSLLSSRLNQEKR